MNQSNSYDFGIIVSLIQDFDMYSLLLTGYALRKLFILSHDL